MATALVVRAQSFPDRYRVQQTLRLETTQSQGPSGVYAPEPLTTVVEGRLRIVMEQTLGTDAATRTWRLLEVEIDPPRTSPPDATNPDVERALQLGLNWMAQSQGKDFTGSVSDLPVVPLGEAAPPWLTRWLQWAQTAGFSGVDGDPISLSAADPDGSVRPSYQIRWVRSEFRRQPCHVQESRWVVPMTDASESLPASLAAAGVSARTHFSAQSLEWVSRSEPTLIYAERSAARETFWDMSGVEDPRLRQSVFRLRLSANVTVERLP